MSFCNVSQAERLSVCCTLSQLDAVWSNGSVNIWRGLLHNIPIPLAGLHKIRSGNNLDCKTKRFFVSLFDFLFSLCFMSSGKHVWRVLKFLAKYENPDSPALK